MSAGQLTRNRWQQRVDSADWDAITTELNDLGGALLPRPYPLPDGTSGTDLTAATVRAVNKKFTDNKIQRGNRHLLLSTKDSTALMADPNLAQFFAYNANRGELTNGLITSDLYGVSLHESQLVPVVAGTPNSTKNLAFDPGAVILASRRLPDAPSGTGAVQSVVTDPVSGLALRVTMSYNADNLGVQVTMDTLYGVAKLRDEKGFTVLS